MLPASSRHAVILPPTVLCFNLLLLLLVLLLGPLNPPSLRPPLSPGVPPSRLG
jgi:hypothetical protein